MQNSNSYSYPTYESILSTDLSVYEASEIYTYKVQNEHDIIFKDLFSDKDESTKFINKFLNLDIPIKSEELEAYNTSFITPEYKSKEADIVYKIKNKNIFFLIEHQSTIDLSMPYRIENYSILIINRAIEKSKIRQKDYLYPKVIPIVLYTGEKKWKASLSFSDIQEKLPGYKEKDKTYTIVDINNFTENELLEDNLTISKVLLLEKTRTNENFIDNIKKVTEKTDKEKLYIIEKIVNLILRKDLGDIKADELLEKIRCMKEEENMLLVVERLRKDREREIKKWKKESKELTTLNIAKKMLKENVDVDFINRITGLAKDDIEKLKV